MRTDSVSRIWTTKPQAYNNKTLQDYGSQEKGQNKLYNIFQENPENTGDWFILFWFFFFFWSRYNMSWPTIISIRKITGYGKWNSRCNVLKAGCCLFADMLLSHCLSMLQCSWAPDGKTQQFLGDSLSKHGHMLTVGHLVVIGYEWHRVENAILFS